ncbi:rhodanese-like domain-containing protein [Streptomyces sp. TLI_171]|uniref:rhodanese-like domain-containing protein n=1 Tax=Streptomyces sp. TLI_171 TaxID=1938859 RepID=UPI000C66EFB2|nr:rhodanese-like domain-containing protein [Streptomyces sp. TLI_171]RKE22904.1 rhodanese-related sulfurtransferase [Streptomyces sp. TLI_171]
MAWTPQPAPAQIDPAEAHRLAAAGEVLLLDVREPAEYAEVHAPGAFLLPLPGLAAGEGPADLARAAADGRPVLAVCRSGNRSMLAAELLSARGVPTANVVGGMRAWALAGLPAHRGECRCGGAI